MKKRILCCSDAMPKRSLVGWLDSVSSRIVFLGVILCTSCLGFIPMMIFSLEGRSFFGGVYENPMVNNVSVMVGDAILLPIFNAYFFMLLLGLEIKVGVVCKVCTLCLILSGFVNYVTHFKIWILDDVTGFMDMVLGELSKAGWVHFGYSTLQMAVIFYFVFVYTRCVKYTEFYMNLLRLRGLLLAFLMLQVADHYVSCRAIFDDWSPWITEIVALFVFVCIDFITSRVEEQCRI